MRWNTFANTTFLGLLRSQMSPLSARRYVRHPSGRVAYLEALEPRQLLSGSAPSVLSVPVYTPLNTPYHFAVADFANQYSDLEGDPMQAIKITGAPNSGTLTLTVGSVSTLIDASAVPFTIPADQITGLTFTPENSTTNAVS